MAAKKYSAIFIEYAAPLLEMATTLDEFRKGVQIATMGWNFGAFDLAGLQSIEDAMAVLQNAPDNELGTAAFEMLFKRRLGEFREYKWSISDAQVRDDGGEWIVRVEVKDISP